MNVTVELDVEIVQGHPVQVLAALRERLATLIDSESQDRVLWAVDRVAKIEIR